MLFTLNQESKVSSQIEFSSFFILLNSIKEGDNEKISSLEEEIKIFKKGDNAKSYLEELGCLYLSIGVTELFTFTNQKDLKSIGLLTPAEWEELSVKNEENLPVFLSNKMIQFVKDNNKIKEISKKWNVREGEIKKHLTKMARYITEGILDVLE